MTIDEQITGQINSMKLANTMKAVHSFASKHVAVIDSILPPQLFEELRAEARALLQKEARRRETTIEESGNTPRAYLSVGRDALAKSSRVIPKIFANEALREFLSHVAGETLERVPYQPEEYILNCQSTAGDTHGWHWDDYSYALIMVLDAPDPLLGGRIEYLPNVEWQRENTESYLRDVLSRRQIESIHVGAGQTYFMKSNTTLHRVAPLAGHTTRSVVVFTYASAEDMVSDSITHTSMEAIYPEASAAPAI